MMTPLYAEHPNSNSLDDLFGHTSFSEGGVAEKIQMELERSMNRVIPHQNISATEFVVDAIYESCTDGQISGKPISKLLPGSGNMGDFRVSGRGVSG